MLKRYSFLIYCLFIGFLIYQYTGCDSDTINSIVNPPPGGYNQVEAGKMMTLSALCYTAEGNTNALQIRDSINLFLADTNYATGGSWRVCWGPGLSPSGSSLMYVAKDSTADTVYYAICIRGTVLSLSNLEEDLDVIYFTPWQYGAAGDSIAYGSGEGFDTLMNTTDPITNQSLQTFLQGLNHPKQKLLVTGHSLGGAMATLITSWAASQSFISNFKLAMYTFAGPTVGNVTFAGTFNARMLSLGAASHRIVNTKDVVPYAWSELQTVLDQNIPDSIPGLIRAIIQTAIQTLQDSHIVYKHVDFKQTLPTLDPVGCGTPGQYGTYVCWVEFEHSSSTYLRLLGVDTINWSGR